MTSVTDSAQPAHPAPRSGAFLEVRDLHVSFPTDDGVVRAVEGLSFSLERGETLGIVGESGSGKSVASQTIMALHNKARTDITGEIWLDGQELVTMPDDDMRSLRGSKVSMIFQDPLSALHPYYRVGDQIVEAYRIHHDVSKAAARRRTVEMLDRVGIPNADKRFEDYPHQFSGGMRQRAMIAMALVNDPELLIADEPTTALDVTVQAQILDLILDLQREFHSAVIVITHDLGVVAETAHDVLVMYGGRCVEAGSVDDVFYRPQMPYTWGLLTSMPRMDRARKTRLDPIPGQPPSLIHLPDGCVFQPRCTFTSHVPSGACFSVRPDLLEVASDHRVRCHIDPQEREQIWLGTVKPRIEGVAAPEAHAAEAAS